MRQEVPELDGKALRNFAWMFAAVVASLFGLILPWILKRDWPWEPWGIAIVFLTWGLIAPRTVRPFYRLWMRFGFVMNFIATRIILGAVFFIFILSFGLAIRLRKRDPLHRKWDHKLQSYRIPSRKPNPRHMERPF